MRTASRKPYSRLIAGVVGKKPAGLSLSIGCQSQYARGNRADFDAASALRADRVEPHARRQHHPLLRAADRDVDAPLVVAVVDGAERGDGVDEQQRRMPRLVDRATDRRDVAGDAGRRLVVDDGDGLDRVAAVGGQLPPIDGRHRRRGASRRE